MRWLPRASLAGLLAALAACGAPKDPVPALLDEATEAAEARDPGRLAERLAEGFQGQGGMPKAEARLTLQRYFAAYQSIDVKLYDVRAEGRQRVRFGVSFSGRPRDVGGLAGLLPSSADYRFDLELADEGGRLVVARASWEAWRPDE